MLQYLRRGGPFQPYYLIGKYTERLQFFHQPRIPVYAQVVHELKLDGVAGVIGQKGIDKFPESHVFRIFHDKAVVGDAELNKEIPRPAKTGAPQCTAVDGLDILQTVFIEVFQRIPVGISFKSTVSFDLDPLCAAK